MTLETIMIRTEIIKKKDLRNGDIVTYRNGNKRIVNKARNRIVYIDDFENLSMDFDSYTNDLYLDDSLDTEYDILQVYRPTTTEVFKTAREEHKKEMTIAQIEKELGYEIRIIKDESEEENDGIKYRCSE